VYQRVENSTPVNAAIYCRISLNRFQDTNKVDDQERICRDLAAARNWTVDNRHVFKDNSVSAWRRDRRRPGWDAMLAAVHSGEVSAIVVYHGDRMVRQIRDLEDLIDLADRKGVRLAAPVGERDLDNADDRYILRIEAAGACRESDNTSRRLKWHYDKRAQQGMVRLGGRGGRAFGFEPDGLTVREADAEVIREVARRILGCESVSAICRDLNARGIRTTAGNEFAHSSLSKLMQRARLAGLVEHNGVIVGAAAWPAILDRDVWESVCAALSGKAQALGFAPANNSRYLLPGIAVCGSCSHTIVARHNRRGVQLLGYGCINPGCGAKVHRAMKFVDAHVQGWVVEALSDPRVREAMAPDVDPHLVQELERLERRRDALFEQLADADPDDGFMERVQRITVPRIEARIGVIRASWSSRLAVRAVDGLFGVSFEEFLGLPLLRRRAVVRALVRVTICRSGRRGPVFDPGSVRLEPVWVA
jgi:DNA invertase Pin-like site-specific DNA recombinase